MTELDWRLEISEAFARRRRTPDPDVLEELSAHAEASYAAARADGLGASEARDRVREEIGAWSREVPDLRRRPRRAPSVEPLAATTSPWAGLAGDLRFAGRVAVQRPGATAVSVLTVALGIAATTSLFSLTYGVLLRPLPWPDADRLVRVAETRENATRQTSYLTNFTYHAWNDRPSTIESLAAYSGRTYTLDQAGSIERVRGAVVTANLFPMLRASAVRGRVFGPSDEDVVLVSERFARRRFGAPSAALGERLRLDDDDMTVIGVMAQRFGFPTRDVDLWIPFEVSPVTTDGSLSFFSAIARLIGVLPAAQAGRLDVVSTLAEDSLAPVGHGLRSRVGPTRALIIAGQVAVSVLLLVGASLLARSLLNLARLDQGYRPDHLLTGRVISTVPATPARGLPGLSQIVSRVGALPGVSGVAVASALPLPSTGESMIAFRSEPDAANPSPVDMQARQRSVTPSYFDVLGMRIVEGRGLSPDDARRTDTTAAVVNRTFARAYFGGRPLGPFGQRPQGRSAFDIVGVVDDIRPPTGEPAEPEMFIALGNLDRAVGLPALFVRTTGEPAALVPAVRGVIREISPTLGLDSAMSMDDRLAERIAGPRLYAIVAGAFAGFALLITGVGLFGVLSYAVAQRRRELGVRAALGATPGGIVRLVVSQGLWPLAIGAVAGLLTAALLARYLSSLLYGVVPYDPLTFAVVPLVLMMMAVLACLVPARRAATIDPLKALRQG